MFVVNLVRLANRHEVRVLGPLEPRKTLMDEDVVNQEIGQTIQRDARPNPKPKVLVQTPGDEAVGAGDGENEKERVVFLEEARTVGVVICVEVPHRTVHQVFVGRLCHAFHDEEGEEHNEGWNEDAHDQGIKFNDKKNTANTKTNIPERRFVFKSSTPRHKQPNNIAATHHVR